MDLTEQTSLPETPFPLFRTWLDEAQACDAIMYAGAMCLSTVDPDGHPDGRIVLLHAVDPDGFAFFTDRRSRKGQALQHHPHAALTFYWGPLERQVRVRGPVDPAHDDEADAFFAERPRRSQITAWASTQSTPVPDRSALEVEMQQAAARFENMGDLPRPPYWQAYRLRPAAIEFWQARARRLHDRIVYTATEAGWTRQRLAP